MGVSQKAFNEKQRRRLFQHHEQRDLPENITTSEVVCKNCSFRARYQFVRCPQCDEERK